MATQEFFTTIRRAFSRDFTVAAQPDHPYLISGPDVLLGRDGVLVALITPKAKERRSPTSLLVRLAACRLALPAHTRFLLLLSKADEPVGSDPIITASVDEVFRFEPGRRANFSAMVEYARHQGREPTRIGREVSSTQQRIFSRSGTLAEETQRNLEPARKRRQSGEKSDSRRPQEVIASLKDKRPYEPAPWSERERRDQGLYFADQSYDRPPDQLLQVVELSESKSSVMVRGSEGLIGAVDLPSNRSPMDKLSRFFDDGFQFEFALDNGVPYWVSPAPKVLFVDEPPTYRLDPVKPARVMAFSGWVLAEAMSQEDPDTIYNAVVSRVKGLQL